MVRSLPFDFDPSALHRGLHRPQTHGSDFFRRLTRRDFARCVALGALPLLQLADPVGVEWGVRGGGRADASEPSAPTLPPAIISRQRNPDNFEFPFSSLSSFLTPNEQFYVRDHFERPKIDRKSWQLGVEGAVDRPLRLTYDELREMPAKTVTCFLECAGNGRVFLKPPQVGVRWDLGGVSNAEWTGVPLSQVLKRAGVKPKAVEVILEGRDQGDFKRPNAESPGIIPYARSLPLTKARSEEVILAYRMNGEELPAAHGFPLRAIVPAWYGMASVKWLNRIILVDRAFRGYFQTSTYTIWQRRYGLPSLFAISEVEPKAQIARPAFGEIVPKNQTYRIHGAAWTGEADIAKVEISTDAGKQWANATLLEKPIRYAWRLWEFSWQTPATPGRYTAMARATDSRGKTQPMRRDPDRRDSMISHVLPIEVELR